MNNTQVYEKVGIKEIFQSLKNILVGNKLDNSEKEIEEKLKYISEVQSQIGATKSINSLIDFVQTYETTSKKVSKKPKIEKNVIKQQQYNSIDKNQNITDYEMELDK